MAHPTFRVDFARTDDHGHVLVRTVAAGDQVTMIDDAGTSCAGTVVLHSPECGLLLVRPNPGTTETTVEEQVPRPRPAVEALVTPSR
jgi:thiamine monophosphate kinase